MLKKNFSIFFSKTNKKQPGSVAQVVEHLPSKREAEFKRQYHYKR
jgi:hypothetical protein